MINYNINVVKYQRVCAAFSFLFLAVFAGFAWYRYSTRGSIFSYSIEFTGGTQVLFKFEKPVSAHKVKEVLQEAGWENPITREFSATDVLVRVKEHEGDVKGLGERMHQTLDKQMPDNKASVLQTESIGSGVGNSLRWKSIYAGLIGIFLMMLYIAFRFWSVSYALGAVISLLHDALVIIGVFMFLDREISVNVVGAVLAVLGYSMNDTIVIYSQIRHNIKKLGGSMPIEDIVNLSVNQTLRRTLLVSFATTLTVLSLLFLGGEALRDLSIALLVGIVFGCYSSIYIASPIMMYFYRKQS
jgi:preprotein translocase subunit SecF